MAGRSIAIEQFPDHVARQFEGSGGAVLELVREAVDAPLLAVARSPHMERPIDRRPSFFVGGRPTHFWKPARTAHHDLSFLWTFTQDVADSPVLLAPDGAGTERFHPHRHELRPNTATRLGLNQETDMLLVAVASERSNSAFPFRLTSDVPIVSMTHLGAVVDVDVAIAFAGPGISTLGSSDTGR